MLKLLLWGMLLLCPFINRPLFVDDHAHFAEAVSLSKGQNFYKSGHDSLGWQQGHAPGEANPPFYFYVVSRVIRYAGIELWKSHLLMMCFTLLGLFSFNSIATRYVRHPLWASALWLATPHVWLTANSLLLDAMLAPLLLSGLALWIKGWENKKNAYSAIGVILLGLAPLVKYTGLLGWGLAILWVCVDSPDKKSWRWLWMSIPFALFLTWIIISRWVFGQDHFTSVAAEKMTVPTVAHIMTLMVFIAGTMPVILFAIPGLLRHQVSLVRWLVVFIAILSISLGVFLIRPWAVGFQFGFWMGSFAVWVLLCLSTYNTFWKGLKFLAIWGGLSVGVLLAAIPWVCARYLVILSPPFILITLKMMEDQVPFIVDRSIFRHCILGVLSLGSLVLACADYGQATSDFRAAYVIEQWREHSFKNGKGYFPAAHLGSLGYYLAEKGWEPLTPDQSVPSGALLVLPQRTLPPRFWPTMTNATAVASFEFPTHNRIRTLDYRSGSGYYGSIWGPLPFSFSKEIYERYVLIETH